MQINESTINTKSELLNIIKDGINPLDFIKEERDIDFVSNAIAIEGNQEDPYWEESAELLLKSILYYLVFTDGENKTLARCKEIVKIGLQDESKEKVRSLLEKEERANVLYKAVEIAPDKTYKSIFETLVERLDKIC